MPLQLPHQPGPSLPLLNGVAEGTTPSTRIGRKITMKSIQLVWTARFPTGSTGGCTLRFRIVYDKQANGAAPSAISMFQTDSYYAPNNLGNADRYITVVDHITDPMSADGDRDVSGRIYKKLDLIQCILVRLQESPVLEQVHCIYLFLSQVELQLPLLS